MKIQLINHAVRVELTCPKCGKQGVLFLSRKQMNDRKILRVYHHRCECWVPKAVIDELLNGYFNSLNQIKINR